MTQEKVEGRTTPEPALFFKEPEKKKSGGRGIWILGLIIFGAFYFLKAAPQITGTGTLKAQKYIKLQAGVPGILKEMIRKKGDHVQGGEILAHFENPEIAKDLAIKKKSLEMSNEELGALQQTEAYLKSKNERAAILFENGVIGKSDFEKVALEYSDFQKKVSLHGKKKEVLKDELAYIESEAEKLDLKAPFTGVLLSDPSERLSNYFKQDDDVFEIGDPSSFYVEMPVRENQIEEVHVGDRAVIVFDAVAAKKYTGVIVGIGVKTDQEVEKVFKVRHVVVCEIKLNEETAGLRYGMQARVVLRGSASGIQEGWGSKIFKKGESNFNGTFKS